MLEAPQVDVETAKQLARLRMGCELRQRVLLRGAALGTSGVEVLLDKHSLGVVDSCSCTDTNTHAPVLRFRTLLNEEVPEVEMLSLVFSRICDTGTNLSNRYERTASGNGEAVILVEATDGCESTGGLK